MSTLEKFFADLDEKLSIKEIKKRIENGENPQKLLVEARKGLRIVGERFEMKQYALIELEMAEELFRICATAIKTLSGKKDVDLLDKSDEEIEYADTIDLG
ncbi:MAG: hypothetical protein QF381_04630 [Nitrososphaerales archaeon]|jgi:methanogenic corrinoid protein MtbC1|nr:hypothetical protein [Nitrososphaerales archaeon]|tara:strand:+ start:304 stop:606 length:303 start_codon:yes stop_codon:yes gene_type:complete